MVIRHKHGDLYQAIKRRGWTIRQAAEFLGIDEGHLGRIINLRMKPPAFRNQKGGQARLERLKAKLLILTGKSFDELFPGEVFNDRVMERAKSFDFFVDRDMETLKIEPSSNVQVFMLPEAGSGLNCEDVIAAIREILTPREWKVLEMRYLKGFILDEVAHEIRCTRERARQIELHALHKVRNNSRVSSILRGNEIPGFDSLIRPALNITNSRAVSA